MSQQSLLQILKDENNETQFGYLPFYAFEIAKLLFKHASDDFTLSGMDINKTRISLKDIEDKRNCKIKNGYKSIETDSIYLELNGITSNELNKCRNYMCLYLNIGHNITEIKDIQQNGNSQSQNDNNNDDYKYNGNNYNQQSHNDHVNMDEDDVNETDDEEYGDENGGDTYNVQQPQRKLRRLQK